MENYEHFTRRAFDEIKAHVICRLNVFAKQMETTLLAEGIREDDGGLIHKRNFEI